MITRTWIGPPLPTEFITAATMRGIGDTLIDRIRMRTATGQDAHGGAFEPLSLGYAKWKAKSGASMAPLTLSGAMLNGMSVTRYSWAGVTLGFTGGSQGTQATGRTFSQKGRSVSNNAKALYHCVEGAGKSRVIRDFFDLAESDIEAVFAAAVAAVTARLA